MAKMHDNYCEEYLERFENKSNIDIISALNRKVWKPGWGPASIGYLTALQ